jgi:hypothetical protein
VQANRELVEKAIGSFFCPLFKKIHVARLPLAVGNYRAGQPDFIIKAGGRQSEIERLSSDEGEMAKAVKK